MTSKIDRICDMRKGSKLSVFKSDIDGDIHVSVLKENDVIGSDSVEICASGTQSPNTYKALCHLMRAMKEDQQRTPHPQPADLLKLRQRHKVG